MAGISVYPDGQYEHGAAWNNANDRVMWERTFSIGTDEARKIAQAMITQNMATSDDEIRAKLSVPPPPAPLPGMTVAPTLDDVLNIGPKADPVLNSRKMTDFSGTSGSMSGTSGPGLSAW